MEIKIVKNKDKLPIEVKEAQEALKELKSKEHSATYDAMMEKNSNALKDIAAAAGPWEWSYGLDLLVAHLRWMRDYYKLGENVWGAEEEKARYTRLEGIEKALYYYDMWQTAEDRFIKVVSHPETYHETDNGNGTVTIDDLGYHCVYKYGTAKRTYKKLAREERKWQKKFYKMLLNHYGEWWD